MRSVFRCLIGSMVILVGRCSIANYDLLKSLLIAMADLWYSRPACACTLVIDLGGIGRCVTTADAVEPSGLGLGVSKPEVST